jgi:hypothetical protein
MLIVAILNLGAVGKASGRAENRTSGAQVFLSLNLNCNNLTILFLLHPLVTAEGHFKTSLSMALAWGLVYLEGP